MTSDTLALVDRLNGGGGGLAFDLGSGTGHAAFEAALLAPGYEWICLDIRRDLLGEARRTACSMAAPPPMSFVCCDAASVPVIFEAGCAALVLCNPPYGIRGTCRLPSDTRAVDARVTPDALGASRFTMAAAHLLGDGGSVRILSRPAGLARLLRSLEAFGMGSPVVQPLGEEGSPATLVRVEALKGGRAPLVLMPQEPLPAFARPRSR